MAIVDVTSYNSYYNVQGKIGGPGDAEKDFSGIADSRVFSNSLFAKVDSLASGIAGIGTISLSGVSLSVTLDPAGTWDDRFLPSGSLIPLTKNKVDLISGMIGILPTSIATRASQASVDLISGIVSVIPSTLASRSTQASVDLLSGMVGILPTAIPAYASQASVDLVSGLVGALPSSLATLPQKLTKGTYFKTKTQSSVNLVSGVFVTTYSGTANADMTIDAINLTTGGATVVASMRILDAAGAIIYPYSTRIAFTSATDLVPANSIALVSGMFYNLETYSDTISGGTGTSTLSALKIVERI